MLCLDPCQNGLISVGACITRWFEVKGDCEILPEDFPSLGFVGVVQLFPWKVQSVGGGRGGGEVLAPTKVILILSIPLFDKINFGKI